MLMNKKRLILDEDTMLMELEKKIKWAISLTEELYKNKNKNKIKLKEILKIN